MLIFNAKSFSLTLNVGAGVPCKIILKYSYYAFQILKSNIDWDSVINQAQDWASKLGDKINDPGFWEKLGNFFMDLWDKIKSLFS